VYGEEEGECGSGDRLGERHRVGFGRGGV
jgi:hypothetical protein